MKQLFSVFHRHLEHIDLRFERYLEKEIRWNNRLIAIIGARGCGKTTMLLQHIKKVYGNSPQDILYTSLDNIFFTTNRLYDLATDFSNIGGKVLFLDEVHKYPNWSREIKNIYDDFPNLKIVFTGSSMLEIYKSDVDLSRRAIHYLLHGMSFREYLVFEGLLDKTSKTYTLEEVLTNHVDIAKSVLNAGIKPVLHFKEYLKYGYYPYYKEDVETYYERVLQTFSTIIENDLLNVENVDMQAAQKIKKLFYILAGLVPFSPNISKLSSEMNITRTTLSNYLHYLEKAQAIMLLEKEAKGMSQMVKPEKIFLQNANYLYALNLENINVGTIRETFFFNQLRVKNKVNYIQETDFMVNKKYCFEIGGKNKNQRQISNLDNAFLALDDIETGFKNEIPLWLFGFLY